MVHERFLIKRNQLKWVVLAIALLIAGLFIFWPKPVHTQVEINGKKITVEVVSTDLSRNKGLSGRATLPKDSGMLFLFEKPDYYIFWMKDMQIPIDIIYIKNLKIVELVKSMPSPLPGESPAVYKPVNTADMVLEVNAGLSEEYGWKVGDSLIIKN